MALILNIDTALDNAYVSLSYNGENIKTLHNDKPREHISFLHLAVAELFASCGKEWQDLAAIAVVSGPGSYTGLRVGMSAAKGYCYALNKPLIGINTLKLMAAAWQLQNPGNLKLICPMIDARRMEVFTTIYTPDLEIIKPVQPLILTEDSYAQSLNAAEIVFIGNGSEKLNKLPLQLNISIHPVIDTVDALAALSYTENKMANYLSLHLAEPEYGKEFFTG